MSVEVSTFASKVCAVAVILLIGSPVAADALHDHDNGPLTGFIGIPDSTEGSRLLDAGRSSWQSYVMTSSHSLTDTRLGETVLLDGETTRLELIYRRGLTSNWEIGVELPYLWHESGGLDSLVDSWHGLFGLPEGNRRARPRDELAFLYSDPSGTRVNFRHNANGIGDVRLLAAYRLHSGDRYGMALRFGLKLPTGDSENLLGSGSADFSLGLAGDADTLFGVAGLSGFYRINAILVGEPELLSDRYEELLGHAAIGLGYELNNRVELRVQGALRSTAYDSSVEVLGDPSGTITFGGHIRLSDRFRATIAVSEDVKVKSAPDVSFQLGLQYLPK